jgi:hypothetical protein
MWASKNKNRPVSGFFTKTAYVQVMNFIPVKVSTLYVKKIQKVFQIVFPLKPKEKKNFIFLFVYPLLLVGYKGDLVFSYFLYALDRLIQAKCTPYKIVQV